MRVLFLLLAVLLVSSGALAQPKGKGPKGEERRAKMEERLNQIRSRVLREKVGLDEAKAKQVEQILNKYEPERVKQRQAVRESAKALSELIDKDSNDQKAYERALLGMRTADKKLAELRDKELQELAKVLTPKQQAKLVISIRQMRRAVGRRMRGDGPPH